MKSATVQQVRTTAVRKWGNGHGVLTKGVCRRTELASAEVETVLQGSSIVLTKKPQRKR